MSENSVKVYEVILLLEWVHETLSFEIIYILNYFGFVVNTILLTIGYI